MKKFISFPKIGQFRQVIRQVVDSARYFGNEFNNRKIFKLDVIEYTAYIVTVDNNDMIDHIKMWKKYDEWCYSVESTKTRFEYEAGKMNLL